MHSFEVHSNESACRKSGLLGLEQVLTLYGQVGPVIGPSQTLVLDTTVQDKAMFKKLTREDVQIGFTNGHVVDQQL